MNFVSPFGRLSRKGYLAVAVPMTVVIFAVAFANWQFAPAAASMEDLNEGPWFRWMLIAVALTSLAQWCLFCAAVKRLHDFRWTGLIILPLLWPWLRGAVAPVIGQATLMWQQVASPDPETLMHDLDLIGIALGLYSLAALIVLAIIPTDRRYRRAMDTVTA